MKRAGNFFGILQGYGGVPRVRSGKNGGEAPGHAMARSSGGRGRGGVEEERGRISQRACGGGMGGKAAVECG